AFDRALGEATMGAGDGDAVFFVGEVFEVEAGDDDVLSVNGEGGCAREDHLAGGGGADGDQLIFGARGFEGDPLVSPGAVGEDEGVAGFDVRRKPGDIDGGRCGVLGGLGDG